MRIALLPSAYAPAVGGVELLTARLARHLRERGHEVEVWTARSDGDQLPEEEVVEGIQMRRFVFTLPRVNGRAMLTLPASAGSSLLRIRAAIRRFMPDVLHVQCFGPNGSYAAAASAAWRIPLVLSLQGEAVMDDHDLYDRSLSIRLSFRLALRQAQVVTGCSAYVLDDVQRRFGLDPRKAQVVFNGVDLDEAPPTRVDVPFARYVLGVGRVVPKKGFDLLLQAFSKLAAAHPDVGLVIGGEGEATDELKRLASSLGIGNRLEMPGRLDRGQVADLIGRAEALVVPSRVEPFGIVALEGWRAGVPVVVSSRGGLREFVSNGDSGLVVDPFETDQLASAIDSLLVSSALCDRLVDGATQELSAFLWPWITTEYESVYSRVLRARLGAGD